MPNPTNQEINVKVAEAYGYVPYRSEMKETWTYPPRFYEVLRGRVVLHETTKIGEANVFNTVSNDYSPATELAQAWEFAQRVKAELSDKILRSHEARISHTLKDLLRRFATLDYCITPKEAARALCIASLDAHQALVKGDKGDES